MGRAELSALADKYREMIALRRDTGPKDAARLRRLASRFPGALRELDTRSMASLEARLAELESALGGGEAPAWAELQSRFHGLVRVSLRMREAGVRDLAAAQTWLARYVPSDPGDPDRVELAPHLAVLGAPPRGRLSLAVRGILGDGPALDALLFGRDLAREGERE